MTLKKFNDGFYRYRPEPQIHGTVKILQEFYKGSGGRWYVDVELENQHTQNQRYIRRTLRKMSRVICRRIHET